MNRAFIYGSILIVILAASLRFYHLGQRSLWLDEAIAANISRGTLSQMLTLTRGLHSAPIVDPLMLYVVEKVNNDPLGVRTPAAVASVLAVVLMLCFARIHPVGPRAAALSALMLAVAALQIRYAQEVREYSVGVLYAGVILYVFLSYLSRNEEERSPTPLCFALFFAPLIQYGLVLFSFGVLSALFILALTEIRRWRMIRQLMTASGFLALGGLISFFLTLRYQWGDDAWYLKDFFWMPGTSIFRFIQHNTHHLITSFLPGLAAAVISVLAVLVTAIDAVRTRKIPALLLLAFTSCGIVLACSLLHLYPYGEIRQCLFLTPVLCLLASTSLVGLVDKLKGRANSVAFAAIMCLVVVSGILQIRSVTPYAEIEDIQQVLSSLRSRIEPGDGVYIYPGAVFAVDFYVKDRDPRFMYGNYHQHVPEKYVPEMLYGLDPNASRFWIVFSHIYRDEDKRIIHDLSQGWKVEPVTLVKGSALYVATRSSPLIDTDRIGPVGNASDPSQTVASADHTHDTFWDWNLRNSRGSAE